MNYSKDKKLKKSFYPIIELIIITKNNSFNFTFKFNKNFRF